MPLHFRLATPEDDARLRGAFASVPMEGGMRLAFEREPSYFGALEVLGPDVQVMLGEDTSTGDLAAIGTRAIGPAFVNGSVASVGYLSDLRVLPGYRGGTTLARGWKFFRQLDADGRTDIYHTAIFSDNAAARAVLTTERPGVPRYHALGDFVTAGIHPRTRSHIPLPRGLSVVRGDDSAMPRIIELWNTQNAQRQFAPVHRVADFMPGGRWRNLRPSDIFLLQDHHRVLAAAALWDQSSFKQTRVLGYTGHWRWLQCLSRLLHRVSRVPRLPDPGGLLHYGYASFPAVEGADPRSLTILMDAMSVEASRRGWLHLLLSLHRSDPLFTSLRDLPHTPFHGGLYALAPRSPDPALISKYIPHIEAALL